MERLSPYQYTIMKSMAPRDGVGAGNPLDLDKAIQFNQAMFYSLLRRGFIRLNMAQETFTLSKDGLEAFNNYTRGSVKDLLVRSDSESRHEHVQHKLTGTGTTPKKRPKLAKPIPALAALA